ncbi:hypothetical protein ACJEBK_19710 [Peribacillus frigoritolerans]|uniref:hypothetical protein n=1 Tax=Peribacillus frigoritolerans TaxID=450367 RepID=UPI003871F9F1
MKKRLALSIVYTCLAFVVLCIIIPFNFKLITKFSGVLQSGEYFISYLSLLLSLFALIVAGWAFINSLNEPKLELSIQPFRAEKEGPALSIDKKTRLVTPHMDLASWDFLLHNKGDSAARYPVVQINFKNAYFLADSFEGWQAVHHQHAYGYYGFQWTPEDRMIVHPNFPIKLPPMYFRQKDCSIDFEAGDISIEITIVADGFKGKKYNLPVRLDFNDFEPVG